MGVDVVDEGEDVLGVAVVVLHRQLDADVVALGFEVDDVVVQRLAAGVQVLDHLAEPALGVEGLLFLFAGPLVRERYGHALVEERQLAQSSLKRRVLVDEDREDRGVGLEPDLRARLPRADLGQHLELRARVATREVHVVLLAGALHPDLQLFGEGVDHRDADAVQSARDLVAVLVELPAGVEDRHRQLDAGDLLDRVDVDRNSAAVVLDGDRIVLMDDHRNAISVSGKRFVDRVVDYLVHQVVEAALRRRTDIHAGALANCFQPLEHLNLFRTVRRLVVLVVRFCHEPRCPKKRRKNLRGSIGKVTRSGLKINSAASLYHVVVERVKGASESLWPRGVTG